MIRRLWTQLTGGCAQCEDRDRVRASRQRRIDEALASATPAQLTPHGQHRIDQIQTAAVNDFANNGVDLADPEDALVALVTVHEVEAGRRVPGELARPPRPRRTHGGAVVTDPSLLDPLATVVDRRGRTHLAKDGCTPTRPADGPCRPGTIGEIDCRDCRILAKLQHGRGELPGGTL